MEGYTRNLSETGLAIVVPSLHFGGRYLNVVGSPLHIQLALPQGRVRIRATPVRCERLEDEEGYLIGVRITEMNDSEWVKLVQYVRALRAA
jgi:PilZ domain